MTRGSVIASFFQLGHGKPIGMQRATVAFGNRSLTLHAAPNCMTTSSINSYSLYLGQALIQGRVVIALAYTPRLAAFLTRTCLLLNKQQKNVHARVRRQFACDCGNGT
ncbi:hypothetical protein IF1G_06845 [Cordyceps javanica]|uniref:Uncharacterized protein n=1 Tax=Cordyceps javanica TaxID=43265 RepID=A0A545UZD6_9HYPO|nr:hypothetical protein IF1G_06845 [Cordyceps javanica]TQW06704.1 hypothetical protein IF2G_06126 [Cordyceps javanica]